MNLVATLPQKKKFWLLKSSGLLSNQIEKQWSFRKKFLFFIFLITIIIFQQANQRTEKTEPKIKDG